MTYTVKGSGPGLLLAHFLTLMATGDPALERLSPAELADSVAGLAEFVPTGTPEQVRLVEEVDTTAELAGIGVPTLVVAATLDRLASPELSRELAAGIPGAELVEVESGHLVAAEAPEQWGAAVRGFLDRHR
ncbi:alpha/beta fold hydrolase [Nocardiopsis aegyptia]|uniref:alpha/beta fold hydrolase n=1 Tax=Nocardiopsis aegyptia TaxID=220378 RepID=UPI0036712BA2